MAKDMKDLRKKGRREREEGEKREERGGEGRGERIGEGRGIWTTNTKNLRRRLCCHTDCSSCQPHVVRLGRRYGEVKVAV